MGKNFQKPCLLFFGKLGKVLFREIYLQKEISGSIRKAAGGVFMAVAVGDAPATKRTVPFSVFSVPKSRTLESPKGLGLKGERVANTPNRVFPPKRGGRTVGDQSSRMA